MANATGTVVVRAFKTRGEAERALDSLRHAGFSEEKLGIAGPGELVGPDPSPTARLEHEAEDGGGRGHGGRFNDWRCCRRPSHRSYSRHWARSSRRLIARHCQRGSGRRGGRRLRGSFY